MNTIELIKNRRSIRKYKQIVVEKEVLEEVVDLAKYAPSWGNTQIARYTFISDEEIIKNISELAVNNFSYNQATLKNAKNLLVLSYVKGKSGVLEGKGDSLENNPNKWEEFDSGLACQTFCLAAFEKGLGTCIFGVINEKEIARIINLPEDETVSALIVYGYIDEEPVAPKRHNTEDIIRFL